MTDETSTCAPVGAVPDGGGAWVVAAGAVCDGQGKELRGLLPVAESGLSRERARARAKELSGRALDGACALFAAVEAAEGSEGPRVAAAEDGLCRKSARERAASFEEAQRQAREGEEADGRPRAVVAAPPMRPGAKAGVAAACVAVAAAVAVGCVWAASPQPQEAEPAAQAQDASAAQLREVSFEVVADTGGVEVAVRPEFEILDGEGEAVESGAIGVNEAASFELADGAYSFELTRAPVLSDGTTFKLPDEPLGFEVSAGAEGSELKVELEAIAAADMTKEQLEAVADELDAAGEGQAAQAAREASQSAPSVAGSAESVSRPQAPASGGGSSSGAASPSGGASQASPGASGGSQSSGGGSGSSSGSSEPAHQHSWVDRTERQWVPNQVWVQDSAAWDEPVYSYEEHEICNTCGKDVTGYANQHLLDSGRGGCQSWRSEMVQVQTDTIHHDATGHYEDQGHYEDVVVGQVCSTCGATR